MRGIPARVRRPRAPLHGDPPRAQNLVPSVENLVEDVHASGQCRRHQRPLHASGGYHLRQHRVHPRPHRRNLRPTPRALLVPSQGIRGRGESPGEVAQSSRAAPRNVGHLPLKKSPHVKIRLSDKRGERAEVDGGGEGGGVVA